MNDTELLLRDVAALYAAHATGTWRPHRAEAELAESLAPAQWTAPLFRAVLRACRTDPDDGSLFRVLETAAAVLEEPRAADRLDVIEALTRLRRLVDALAGCP